MDSYLFVDGVYVYFVTFTIVDWLLVFVNPESIEILFNSLKYCTTEKILRVHAYVIMPNHPHLIVLGLDFDNNRLHKALSDFRKFTGSNLANYNDNHLPGSLSTTIRNTLSNDRSRQVWQPGWHALALASAKLLSQKTNYIHENPVRKGFGALSARLVSLLRQLLDDWGECINTSNAHQIFVGAAANK